MEYFQRTTMHVASTHSIWKLQIFILFAFVAVKCICSAELENSDNLNFSEETENYDDYDDTYYPEGYNGIFVPYGTVHTMDKLISLAGREEKIYHILKLRRMEISKEINLITRHISDYEETSGKALAGAAKSTEAAPTRGRQIGENSVLSHCMTERYAGIIAELKKQLNSVDYNQVTESLAQVLDIHNLTDNEFKWPNKADLFLSHTSLLELQHINSFETDLMIDGLTFDTNFGGVLNPSHCALLGTIALKYGHYFRSVEWLEITLEYLSKKLMHLPDNEVLASFVKSLLPVALQVHNQKRTLLQQSSVFSLEFMHLFIGPAFQNEISRSHVSIAAIDKYGHNYGNGTNNFLNMLSLCMGHQFQPVYIKSHLTCYLERKRHPYFILNPLKTEQLSEYPYIVQFYDVLGNDTMDELYDARGELLLSTVTGRSNIDDSISARNSAGSTPTWEYTYKIQNRSEILTGLLLTDMYEGIQTVEYTYGRYYKVHPDAISDSARPVDFGLDWTVNHYGDRIATLLYYVDVPTDGGGTPFSEVGIVARPVRGSAVFWVNMFRNGSVRPDISHASCPVIHGFKTIINQWFRYNSNFHTFTCSLNQLE